MNKTNQNVLCVKRLKVKAIKRLECKPSTKLCIIAMYIHVVTCTHTYTWEKFKIYYGLTVSKHLELSD